MRRHGLDILTVVWVCAAMAAPAMTLAAPASGFLKLTSAEEHGLMRFLRSQLTVGLRQQTAPTPPGLRRPFPAQGLLALYWKSRRFARVVGSGESLQKLAVDLSRKMGRALWKSAQGAQALREGTLKLDIALRRRPARLRLDMPVCDPEELGLRGVIVHARPAAGKGAAPRWISPLEILLFGHEPTLLQLLGTTPGLTVSGRVRTEVFYAYTLAEAKPGGKAYRMYRAGPLYNDLQERDALDAVLRAVAWLLDTQAPNAKFLERYHALTRDTGKRFRIGPRRKRRDYSVFDHLRAVEPLLRVYEATVDESIAEAAKRALRFAQKQVLTMAEPPRHALAKRRRVRRPAEQVCYVGEGTDLARATAMLLTAECRGAQTAAR